MGNIIGRCVDGCGMKFTEEDVADQNITLKKCPNCGKLLYWSRINRTVPPQPKCPKCGSTAITSGARGINLTWGMIGASSTVNRCGNCGHTWKPTGR